MKNYSLARIDWGVGHYIDSIRFTMTDGAISPKYGSRSATSNYCVFESRINKIKVSVKDNRLVGLIFYTEHDGEFLRIESSRYTNNTATVELVGSESFIGFRMRIANKAITGLSFTMLTSQEILE